MLVSIMGFIFAHFVYEESFELISQIIVFHFVHFECKKDFWHILIQIIEYRVFHLSSWSNKKQFQLVDLVIARNILTLVCNGFHKYRLLD